MARKDEVNERSGNTDRPVSFGGKDHEAFFAVEVMPVLILE